MITPAHHPTLQATFQAAGFPNVTPWGPAGLEARTPTVRSTEVAGDQLFASVSLAPDGALRYDYLWLGALPYDSIPTARPVKEPRQTPLITRAEAPASGLYRIEVKPAGDPASAYQHVQITTTLSDPEALAGVLDVLAKIGTGYNGPYGQSQRAAQPADPYYLMEHGLVATFREVVDGEDRGFTAYVATHVERIEAQTRARIMQIDLAGRTHRYEVLCDARGVFVDLPTTEGGRHQDWIWEFPITDRTWTEEDAEAGLVHYELRHLREPVDVEAGRFERCVQLSSSSLNGHATHVYAPLAGLIKSEFRYEGLQGRRELWDLEKDYSWLKGGCHAPAEQA